MKTLKLGLVMALSGLLAACGGSSNSNDSHSSQSSTNAVSSTSSLSSSEGASSSSFSSESSSGESSSSHTFSSVPQSSSSDSSSESSAAVSSSSSADNSIPWSVYNADHHPNAAGSITLADGSLTQFETGLAQPPEADFFTVVGDGTVNFDSSDDGNDRFLAQLDGIISRSAEYPKYFTFLAGITGNNSNHRIIEIETAFADEDAPGSRLKTIFRADGNNKGVQLERANNNNSVDAFGLDMSGFGIYQVAITLNNPTQANVQVFVNGSAIPLISLSSATMRDTNADGDNFIRIGDGGGSTYLGAVDWIIWTDSGAYTPRDLDGLLPSDLGCVFGYGDSNNSAGCPEELPPSDTLGILDAPIPSPHDVIPSGLRTFYVDPDGDNAANGSEATPFATLHKAIEDAQPGDVIVMRGGVYQHAETVLIEPDVSGTREHPIKVFAYPGETPVLDFDGQVIDGTNSGIRLNANHWHLYGLTIRHAGHNGIRTDGSHNRLERLVAHNNYDTGIHLAGTASHNLIMNCDSYRNYNDGRRINRPDEPLGGNSDGFGAKFNDLGPGNHFYGNRAWENSDDGYDFWKALHPIVLQNSWAFRNGNPADFGNPSGFQGNGNGFKLGGDRDPGDHIVYRNMSFDNYSRGFDYNYSTGAFTLVHNTAYKNRLRNYNFPNNPANSSQQSRFYNNLSLAEGSQRNVFPSASARAGNSWQASVSPSENMLLSIDTELAKGPRKPDGSLPDLDLLRPAAGSMMIDGGIDLGRPYEGTAPDIGTYEYQD